MKRLCSLFVFIGLLVGLATCSSAALGEGTSTRGGPGASSSLGGSLVTPGSPTQGEQAQAAEEAKLASPNTVAETEASRTKFEGLDTEAAIKLAGEAFPAVIDDPAGGPPKLPAGQSITGFPADDAAQVDLPEGKHAVIESTAPMAIETSPGHRTPVDLGLTEVRGMFEPKAPVVGVQVPKRLSDGVTLGSTGLSLTPVDAQGVPLEGSEGAIDGASVFYANTQTDSDTVVKPVTAGFETDTLLRSVASPQKLFFGVGLPEGASLAQGAAGSGAVQVVKEGTVIATVVAPGARDAAGTLVPVSMSVSGDTLVLSVADQANEYQYPIEVDPAITDEQLVESYRFPGPSNWREEPAPRARSISSKKGQKVNTQKL